MTCPKTCYTYVHEDPQLKSASAFSAILGWTSISATIWTSRYYQYYSNSSIPWVAAGKKNYTVTRYLQVWEEQCSLLSPVGHVVPLLACRGYKIFVPCLFSQATLCLAVSCLQLWILLWINCCESGKLWMESDGTAPKKAYWTGLLALWDGLWGTTPLGFRSLTLRRLSTARTWRVLSYVYFYRVPFTIACKLCGTIDSLALRNAKRPDTVFNSRFGLLFPETARFSLQCSFHPVRFHQM